MHPERILSAGGVRARDRMKARQLSSSVLRVRKEDKRGKKIKDSGAPAHYGKKEAQGRARGERKRDAGTVEGHLVET